MLEKGLEEQSHGIFPLWTEGLSEEEVLIHQARMFQGAGRFSIRFIAGNVAGLSRDARRWWRLR